MNTEPGSLETLVQTKLDADTDFSLSLEGLSDDEKTTKVNEKKAEIIEQEVADLLKKAGEADKNSELAKNYKTRAEKAEKDLKALRKAAGGEEDDEDGSKKDDISSTDLYALMNAKVHEDDVTEVKKAAAMLGVSIKEALKDDTLQTILAKRVEKRKVADAANTKPARPSGKSKSDEDILKDASEGKLPEKGSKEAEDLFWARRGGKKK